MVQPTNISPGHNMACGHIRARSGISVLHTIMPGNKGSCLAFVSRQNSVVHHPIHRANRRGSHGSPLIFARGIVWVPPHSPGIYMGQRLLTSPQPNINPRGMSWIQHEDQHRINTRSSSNSILDLNISLKYSFLSDLIDILLKMG